MPLQLPQNVSYTVSSILGAIGHQNNAGRLAFIGGMMF
jgi:hypothetical protein